jgi:DNA-nicking Smr family endonuclease
MEPTPAPDAAGETDEPEAIGERDPVVLPIEDAIDLHAFAPRDIPSVVEEYLGEASRRGFSEVRLIHGRGKGVQRAIVQGLLGRHPLVIRFFDAPAERGGWGATIVTLRPAGGPSPTT